VSDSGGTDAAPPATASAAPAAAVMALFVLSGAAGLLYEVLWARQLAHVLGGAYPAVVAVVASFLGGLALGAGIGGRRAGRTARPLRLYAILEAGIGAYALAFPLLLAAAGPVHGWCYRAFGGNPVLHPAANLLVAALLLVPPAAAMGATLPVLVRHVVRGTGGVLGGTALLYGLNTIGAAGGALVTGLVLLPSFGLTGTLHVGVAMNVVVAIAAFVLDLQSPPAQPAAVPGAGPPAPSAASPRPASLRPVLAVATGAGFVGILLQMGWTKALILVLGSSVHAFTLIVAAFILGLGVGGVAAPLLSSRGSRRLLVVAGLEALVGLGAWLSIGRLADLPVDVIRAVDARFGDYGAVLAWEWWTVLGLVLLPTAAMGACFPLLVAAVAGEEEGSAARSVGRVYAWNTAGTILGCLAGGLVAVPLLGIRGALLAATVLSFVLAAVAAASALARPLPRALAAAVPLAAAAALAAAAPAWPADRLHCGPFIYGKTYLRRAEAQGKDLARVLRDSCWDMPWSREGRTAVVGVLRAREGFLSLRINGKTDASTGPDMATQVLVGQITALAHPRPRSAMVLGWATGVSAAAAASHGVERLDVLEISPEVLAADRWFEEANGRVARRPGVRILLEDGRKHMEHARETYDLVVSEPTNPWIAGVSNLFTVEYFRACRERLAPDGVLGVWLQSYSMSKDDFRLVVRTVRSVFPGTTVWECSPYRDYLLLAPRDDGTDLVARVAARGLPGGDVAADLARAGVRSPATVLSLLFAGREGTARIAGEGALHTDDRLQLEFEAPRRLFGDESGGVLDAAALEAWRERPSPAAAVPGVDGAGLARALAAREAEREAYLRLQTASDPAVPGAPLDPAIADRERLRALVARMPRSLADRVGRAAKAGGDALAAEAQGILLSRVIEDMEAIRAAGPGDGQAADLLAEALLSRGESLLWAKATAEALADAERAAPLQPANAVPWFLAACARYDLSGGEPRSPELGLALAALDRCLALNPRHEEALVLRGAALGLRGDDDAAAAAFAKALEVRPDSVRALANLGSLRCFQGRRPEARELALRGLALEPGNRELQAVLRMAEGR
jgi:spermidine synthase